MNSAISKSIFSTPPSLTCSVLHLSQKNSLSLTFEKIGESHAGHLTWMTFI